MEIRAALDLANGLMNTHGLAQKGWTVAIDRAQNRLGLCAHSTRTISMGRVYVLSADEGSVSQTMLHEIAHALVGGRPLDAYGRKEGSHGQSWKSKAREIGYVGERTAKNPAKDTRDEAIVEQAKALAPTVTDVTDGPLRMGERVYTRTGRLRGIMLDTLRTRARILNDRDGKPWLTPLTNIVRENAPQSERVPSDARPYRAQPTAFTPTSQSGPAIKQPVVAAAVDRPLREGDPVVIHYPASSRHHGRRGTIIRVNGTTYTVRPADGSTEIRGTKMLFRLDTEGAPSTIAAETFAQGDEVVIHDPRSRRFHGIRGSIIRVNGQTYTMRPFDGSGEIRGAKSLFRRAPQTGRNPLAQAAASAS